MRLGSKVFLVIHFAGVLILAILNSVVLKIDLLTLKIIMWCFRATFKSGHVMGHVSEPVLWAGDSTLGSGPSRRCRRGWGGPDVAVGKT